MTKDEFVLSIKNNSPTPRNLLIDGDFVVTSEDRIVEICYSKVSKELVLKDIKPLSEVSRPLWRI